MKKHHLLLLLRLTGRVESFCLLCLRSDGSAVRPRRTVTLLRNDDDDDDDEEAGETLPRGIPQLPATLSSFAASTATNTTTTNTAAVVGTKLQLQYTCQICDTRNVHQVSRIAYRQGIVIARCRGCSNQHLIADHHLGGFRSTSTNNNAEINQNDPTIRQDTIKDIETYLQQQGKTVHRVSQQVFDLEQVWSVDTSSGSLMGENGERNME